MKESVARRRLARAERKVEILERLLDDKTRELWLHYDGVRQVHADLNATMAAMPGALLRFDAHGRINLASAAARSMLQWRDALVGTEAEQISPTLAEHVAAHHEGQAPEQFEDAWTTATGDPVPVLVTLAVASDQSLVCVGIDLTERRRLEVDLRHAQKLEAVGQLASGIAHEINTPLQYIRDNLEFVAEAWRDVCGVLQQYQRTIAALDDSHATTKAALAVAEADADLAFALEHGEAAVKQASGGVDRANRVVQAMRGVSNRRTVHNPVDIDRVVSDAIVLTQTVTRGVAQVETQYSGGTTTGSSSDLGQVVINLVVNAAHAIVDAGRADGKIAVTTETDDAMARIRVEDNGCGIPEDVRARIFEPFFTTKKTGRGTGQGLALSYAVIQRHGGHITVDSAPGQGSTFTVHLPHQKSAA